MNKVEDAIRYGIRTLQVSPVEMFSLIESSKDYTGADYKRWLANEIIKIAEKEGVGFSQLLVKKFSIIQSLAGSGDLVMKPSAIEKLSEMMGENDIYSINVEELGAPLPEVDWFEGIDYSPENSFFLSEKLPDLYQSTILGKNIGILLSMNDSSVKKSELLSDANARCVSCKNWGSLVLYRLCQIIDAFDVKDNMMIYILSDTKFLLDKDNEDIWFHFLQYFNYKGTVFSSADLYESSIGESSYAFLCCTPRGEEDSIQNSIELCKEGENKLKRYTRSNRTVVDYLSTTEEESSALGYLHLDTCLGAWLSCDSEEDKSAIKITYENLDMVIYYYSVSTALKVFGINENIRLPITGSKKYDSLFANCIPLFLYGLNSKFRSPSLDHPFNLGNSALVKQLLNRGEIYYSLESKEIIDLCKGYIEFLSSEGDESCKCFDDLRHEANYSEFNNLYLSKLRNLCDYIRNSYRDVI